MRRLVINKNEKSEIIKFIVFICLVVAVFAFVFRDFIGMGVYHWGDILPVPADSKVLFDYFFSTWTSQYLGFEANAAPFIFILGVLMSVLCDAALAQRVYYIYPIAFSVIFMYLLISRFTRSFTARCIGSFVYAINPYSGAFNPGGIFIFGHAFFPLLILYLFKIMEEKNKLRNTLIFTFILGIIVSTQVELYFFIIPFVGIFILVESCIRWSVKFTALTIALVLFSSVFCFLLIAPTSIYHIEIEIAGEAYTQQYVEYYNIERLLNRLRGTYSKATLNNLFLILGSPGAHDWFGYYDSWWTIFGYTLPFLAFTSLIVRSKRQQRYVLAFAIMAISIIGFCWLTHLGLLAELFRVVPALFMYQNPGTLMPNLPLAYSPLIAITLENLLHKIMGLVNA